MSKLHKYCLDVPVQHSNRGHHIEPGHIYVQRGSLMQYMCLEQSEVVEVDECVEMRMQVDVDIS